MFNLIFHALDGNTKGAIVKTQKKTFIIIDESKVPSDELNGLINELLQKGGELYDEN